MALPIGAALNAVRSDAQGLQSHNIQKTNEDSFSKMLKNGIEEVNIAMKSADKSSLDLVSGKSSNLHETMLSVAKAEIGFTALVQIRNKAVEAYQEVMRMQV